MKCVGYLSVCRDEKIRALSRARGFGYSIDSERLMGDPKVPCEFDYYPDIKGATYSVRLLL